MPGIRPVAESDHQVWLSLFGDYADFYLLDLPDEAASQAWQWIHDKDELFWCDVAEQDGRVVGMAQYQLMHRSLTGTKVCYLSDLYVMPEFRGSGAGRALIDQVFAFSKSRGINNVRWLTQDYNYNARKLYDSYGKKSDFILYTFPV